MRRQNVDVAKPPIKAMPWLKTDSVLCILLARVLHRTTRRPPAGIANQLSRGMRTAQYARGYLYYYGYGVLEDRTEAYHLFQEAAARGNEDAKRTLERSRKKPSIDPGAGLSGLQ